MKKSGAKAPQKHHSRTIAPRIQFSKLHVAAFVVLFAVIGTYLVMRIFAAGPATLSITPASSTVGLGNNFTVDIYEDSSTTPINAVQADLIFPTSKLQFVSIDASTSAFGIEAPSSGNNTNGTVTLVRAASGGTTLTGSKLIARVTFKAVGTGQSSISFAGTSVLLESATNTNILTSTSGATITVNDTTAPSVPGTVTAGTRTVNSIAMSWPASTDNVAVTGYRVFRNGTQVGTPTGTSYTDSGLTPNTSYSYRVAAVDAAGNVSAQSTAVSISTLPDTTAPSVPGTVTSSTRTMTSIAMSWPASTDNVAVTGYRVFRDGTQIATPTGTSYTDNGLAPGTSYSYRVAAVDAAGNVSAQSTAVSLSTLADTAAPSVPGTPQITSQSTTSVGFNWAASTDNVGVTGYRIYRDGTQIGTSTTPSYLDSSGLTVNTTYSYRVAAVDAAGNVSGQSAVLSVTISKPSDLNNDNIINVFDLSILLTNYGRAQAQSTNPKTDINGDGTVNIFDLSILLTNYGT